MLQLTPEGESRLTKLVSWGLLVSIFGAGVAWNDLRADTAHSEKQSAIAMSTVTNTVEMIRQIKEDRAADKREDRREKEALQREIRAIKDEQCLQRWMQYRTLKKVDPGSIQMMPEPPSPRECD